MPFINQQPTQKYFLWLRKFFKVDSRTTKLKVDFNKPWYQIYLQQKWRVISAMLMWCVALAWDSIGTLAIAYSIQQQSTSLLGLTLLGYFTRFTLSCLALSIIIYVENSTNLSIQYAATKFFLTVDPIYHSTRSSGQIISKISRGAESFNIFGFILIFHCISVLVSTIMSTIILSFSSIFVALTGFLINLFFGFIAVQGVIRNNQALNPLKIKKEDEQKSIQVEILQQIALIRSAFGTSEQEQKLSKTSLDAGIYTAAKDFGTVSIFTVILYLLIIGVAVVSFLLLRQVQAGDLNPIIAVGMTTIYIDSLNKIMSFSNQAEKLITSISNIQDLFDFIRSFGKQTYPVLESDQLVNCR